MAGSFLYLLLKQDGEFRVGIKDLRGEPDCKCAWGIVYPEARALYRKVGVRLDDYVLARTRKAIVNGVEFKSQIVSFDRRRLLRDLWNEMEFRELEGPDLIVDATGCDRALLPKIRNDVKYATIQFLERHKRHEQDEILYIHARRTGYAWAIPLGDGRWHVGAGEKNAERASELLQAFRRRYGFNGGSRLCSCRAEVRLLPPSRCRPFISGRVVGVGEAVGCVSGFGEGNAPSLKSADILHECLRRNALGEYERRILEEFRWIEVEHRFVWEAQRGRRMPSPQLSLKVILIESRRTIKPSFKGVVQWLAGRLGLISG